MTPSHGYRLLGLLVAVSSSLAAAADEPAATSRPNIIFVLTDDQAPTAAGFAGNAELKTPALDRCITSLDRYPTLLAADGVTPEPDVVPRGRRAEIGDRAAAAAGRPDLAFPGETIDTWHGGRRHVFEFQGRPAWVVEPREPLPGNPWSWCMMFPDAFTTRCATPQLVAAGFHHAYLDVGNTFGSPAAVAQLAEFRDHLVRRGLASKAALVGLSRGGLYAHRYAAEHPDHVAVIYGDAGVCDFKSWPGGKGKGKGSPRDWKACLEAYGFADEAAALAYAGNPIDTLEPLAKAGVALIHVVGDADHVVPPAENALIMEARYPRLGGTITVIHKPGCDHHPHGLDDPQPVVDFILQHAWRRFHGP